jgi:hypothetical protein
MPRDATHSPGSPPSATAIELRRYGATRSVAFVSVVTALPSHGRGHRFETCHAHQPKRFPGSLQRAACQKIFQKTTRLDVVDPWSAWRSKPIPSQPTVAAAGVHLGLARRPDRSGPVPPGVIACAIWRTSANRRSTAWTIWAAISGVVAPIAGADAAATVQLPPGGCAGDP